MAHESDDYRDLEEDFRNRTFLRGMYGRNPGAMRPDPSQPVQLPPRDREAIRLMQEAETAQRMEYMAQLIARLQGTGQEQMGQSPRDQRFWMNEGARREPVPTATRGRAAPLPRRFLPNLSPESFHHKILGDMESGPEPMYGRSGGGQGEPPRQQMERMQRMAEANAIYRNAPRHPGRGLLEPARRGPPNMALRRRYPQW